MNTSPARLVISISLFLFACASPTKPTDCSRFKTGSFICHFMVGKEKVSFLINRNDSIQTETNQQTGLVSTLAIRWIDKCTYELKLMESKESFPDSIKKIRESVVLKTEITGYTNRYYTFRSTRDNNDFILADTLWIQ